VVPPSLATVTFDARVRVCVLRVDGEEIAPNVWPLPEQKLRAAPTSPRTLPSWTALGLALLLAVAVGVFLVRGRGARDGTHPDMSGAYRAPDGRFVAHFPPGFTARPAALPGGASGVVLVDDERGDAVVIVAVSSASALATSDAWLLQKRLHDEALSNLPRADGAHDELGRRDETCLGQRGAVILGRVNDRRGQPARVWSCAVSSGDTGYLVMSSLHDKALPEEEKRLRRVVDATELTQLGELAAPPR
jgi:hypothetical protein